jgi:hypothetical protein
MRQPQRGGRNAGMGMVRLQFDRRKRMKPHHHARPTRAPSQRRLSARILEAVIQDLVKADPRSRRKWRLKKYSRRGGLS